ncbi:MAG TPA: serine/threonine-protein kinase, partial [Gemmatimonadales bacterium]|nr:serine/threonine-protein kinase [Gemmatimonadales bacterium]
MANSKRDAKLEPSPLPEPTLDHGRRLDLAVHTTPAGATAPGALPDDLAAEAAQRLRIACLLFIGLWAITFVMNHLVAPSLALPLDQVVPWTPIADAVALFWIAVSVVVYLAAPAAARRGLLVRMGIAYQIALGFALGLINQWQPQVLAGRLSWICVLILIFPAIVPGSPRQVLAASLVVASMDPVGLLIARARGLELPSVGLLAWAYLPNYICAVLAVLPSHIIERLGRKVRHARELGSYRLVERIGRGGMGEVWRAEHRLLARPAAIKLIRSELIAGISEGVAEARFRREADAAAALRSPHTIQLYDFGLTRDRELYYVMELLTGIDLEELVTGDGPQAPARVVHILRQACRSLAEAHAAGMVHRDIKPGNLHLCRLGLEYDFVKVLDFGLVKGIGLGDADLRLTAPESAAGTPAYMAPELTGGDPVDGRTDLYMLGCVGYYLVTGALVFEGQTAMQVVVRHLQAEPVPPSARLGRPVPAGLERAILRCLAKSPMDRPSSALELLTGIDLEELVTGDGPQAPARVVH